MQAPDTAPETPATEKRRLPVLWSAPGGTGQMGVKLARVVPKDAESILHAWGRNLGVLLAMDGGRAESLALGSADATAMVRTLQIATDDDLTGLAWDKDSDGERPIDELQRKLRALRGGKEPPALVPYRDRLKTVSVLDADPIDAIEARADDGGLCTVALPPLRSKALDWHRLQRALLACKGKVLVRYGTNRDWFASAFPYRRRLVSHAYGQSKTAYLLSNFEVPVIRAKFANDAGELRATGQLHVFKTDNEKRVQKGVFYHANKIDAHGDWVSAEDLERACWNATAKGMGVDIHHDGRLLMDCHVVESYIAEVGYRTKAASGNGAVEVRPGDWIIAVRWSPEVWPRVKSGEINAFSLYGTAIPVPIGAP